MNYITACPECDTQFLLNKEQLKSHRGKVQCGHCSHVFNAKNRLTEISDEITSAAEYQASLEKNTLMDEGQTLEDGVHSETNFAERSVETEDSTYIGEFSSTVQPDILSDVDSPIEIEDLTTDPKFSKTKFKLNIWLSIVGLLLVLFAALQSIYFMRTKIAAEYPQFKPLLAQGCAYVNCAINLPKNVDLLLIDDSDMQEDENYEGVINFSTALINNAGYSQAYPNIELTLTNAEDQPALRRIIKPVEYLKADTKLDAGIAAHEEIRIKLAIHPSDVAVAGYRVLLVY